MTALYIVLGIILLFVLIGLIKVTFGVSYCGDVSVVLKILFFKLRFNTGEQKEVKEKKEKPAKKQKRKTPAKEVEKPEAKKPQLTDILAIIRKVLEDIIGKYKKYIFLEKYIVKINVAADDPAKTAVLYGIVSGMAAGLHRFMTGMKRKTGKKENIYSEVTPDFISESFDIYADIALSIRIWQMMSIGVSAARGYLKYRNLKKVKGEDNERDTTQTDN